MRGLQVPEATEDFTADPVELFFDLAFVFAFSQLVWHLVHDPTWKGAADATLVFLVLWFAWSTFTWAANAVQGNAREVRFIFLVATAASVPMGASVSTAYTSGGGTFAICAGLIVIMAMGLQFWAFGTNESTADQFRSVARFAGPNLLAIAVLIAGGFADLAPRRALWICYVLLIVVALVSARSTEWLTRPGHFAERHGLIVIIALGEIIVAIGISVVNSLDETSGLPGQTLLGLVAAGILAGLMWWGYFDRVLPALEHRAEMLDGRDRARFIADAYTWLHAPIVGGIIAIASATEEILLHPTDPVHAEFSVMFVVGLALFFGGIAAGAFRAYRAIAKERMLAVVAIAVLALIWTSLNGVIFLLAVDAVLLVSLAGEHIRIESPTND